MDLPAFERWLRERDPGVLVAEERIVRRVVKRDRDVAGLGLRVTHGRCLVVSRAALLACASPQDLGVDRELPDRVILLARPPRTAEGDGAVLLARALFHARVHAALDDAGDTAGAAGGAQASLTIDAIRRRVHAIGEAELDEIRTVLRQDDHLPRRPDVGPLEEERATYVEFAALWLELGRFDPTLRAATFPGVHDDDAVERVVSEGLDVEALFEASCPEELAPQRAAPSGPSTLRASGVRAPAAERLLAEVARDQRIDAVASARLRAEAAAARAQGNVVRAALLALEALHLAAPDDRAAPLAEARGDAAELARRLDEATRRDPQGGGSATLTEPLLALAHMAARPALGGDLAVQLGLEARVLYDLQKAAIAAEREVLRVDVVAWALSFGARPVVRSLSPALEVRVAREVHAAERKLALVHVAQGSAARDDAADLRALRRAVHALAADADASVRRAVGPKLQRVLEEVGLCPASRPEEVARTKLVDELVDLAITHGHFDLGQLRDAISRNDLKLPDLRGPHEFVFDDPLLRADRRLAVELDGVYRRGEIYLRGLQKASSLLFGTKVGRFLSLYAILPLLAAFVLLEGVQHLLHPLLKLFGVHEHRLPHLLGPVSFPLTALTIFGLLHSGLVRRLAGKVAGAIGFFFAAVFFRLPMAIAQLPAVRRVLRSEPMAVLRRHVLRPLVLGGLAWLVLPEGHTRARGFHASVHVDRIGGGAILVASFALFLTKYGSAAEEMALDYAVRSLRHVRARVLPGVLKAITEAFAAMVEGSERLIYAVDERLRFGRGEGRLRIVAKGALGLVWGFFAFWIRIYVNLLIEPQVNPIKHFPVVTVSHKIMLPMAPQVVRGLITVLRPIGRIPATAFASITALLLPGVFGFLAWELKENFKLYRASREGRLRPSPIGHHGETMAGLLKPGFHSGTIPKLTAKIRRATRAHAEKLAELQTQRLEIAESIERFFARELTSLLGRAPQWKGGPVEVAHVELGGNRVLVTLAAPRLAVAGAAGAGAGAGAGGDACISFEEQSGFLVAGLAQTGFLDALSDAQRGVFEAALAGLYARAAVDLVREQIESELARLYDGRAASPYDLADDGLLVWPGGDYDVELAYPLDGDDVLTPIQRGPAGTARAEGGVAARPLRADRLIFARQALPWRAWNDAWASDDAVRSPLGVDAPSLLPPRRVATITLDVDARSPTAR